MQGAAVAPTGGGRKKEGRAAAAQREIRAFARRPTAMMPRWPRRARGWKRKVRAPRDIRAGSAARRRQRAALEPRAYAHSYSGARGALSCAAGGWL